METDHGKELWINLSKKEVVAILGCLGFWERLLQETRDFGEGYPHDMFREFHAEPLRDKELARLKARLRRNL